MPIEPWDRHCARPQGLFSVSDDASLCLHCIRMPLCFGSCSSLLHLYMFIETPVNETEKPRYMSIYHCKYGRWACEHDVATRMISCTYCWRTRCGTLQLVHINSLYKLTIVIMHTSNIIHVSAPTCLQHHRFVSEQPY